MSYLRQDKLMFPPICKKTSFWGGAVDNNPVILIHHRVKSKGLTMDNGCLARKWNMGVKHEHLSHLLIYGAISLCMNNKQYPWGRA